MEGPFCAHLQVYYTTQSIGGSLTRGWWECGMCKKEFKPVPPPFTPGSGFAAPDHTKPGEIPV